VRKDNFFIQSADVLLSTAPQEFQFRPVNVVYVTFHVYIIVSYQMLSVHRYITSTGISILTVTKSGGIEWKTKEMKLNFNFLTNISMWTTAYPTL
ncbi:unnamed protein product, partial [Brugia timori]|uniref:Sortilin-Vps10 domain-containing protein n=1 Tax=Brugia timori TaxID=42155 RepID=A0A0R3QPR4_9BILA